MLINRKDLMNCISFLYPFMGAGKNNTATNILSYYKAEDSFFGVTNGSICAFIHTPTYFSRDFKVDGNLFFQTLRGIKSEEVDLFFSSDTTLRLRAYDENDNTTEVDFCLLNTTTMADYCKDNPSTNLDAIPIPETFTEALQTCLPYINTNDGKLSYVYMYGYKAVSANNNASSEIAIYNSNTDLIKLPRMFISGKDGALISKAKVKWTGINYIGDYYRLTGKTKDNIDVSVVLNALNEKERYPVIIDKDRYTEQELNASAYYTVDALLKQFNAEQITFNKDEVKELLDSVIVNGFDPVYNMFTIRGNTIKYEVKYLNLKKSKTIKTKESYPEMSIKLNPNVLKNIMDIGADSISIDRKKIVAKTSNFDYICFLAD